jgi:hypothetical protein
MAIAQKTTVTNNTVTGAAGAMRSGQQTGPSGISRSFPGKCAALSTRSCLAANDCNIAGIDAADKGPCTGVTSTTVRWTGNDISFFNNTIRGPFNLGIVFATNSTRASGNTITGPGRTGAAGITIVGKYALESGIVTANVVSNVEVGLTLIKRFQDMTPTTFGANVSQNDFTGYTTAVLTRFNPSPDVTGVYDMASELSKMSKGNYWGTPCGTGLEPSKVKRVDGTPNPLVKDSHPYGSSVASTLTVNVPSGMVVHKPGAPATPTPCP